MLLTALTALLAFAGAIGLVGGGTDFGETVNSRLPLDSPVLAGVALAVFVGVPMAVAAWLLYRRSDDDAVWVSVVAGDGSSDGSSSNCSLSARSASCRQRASA
ncbi:hypothetical protein [Gordonia westfalica]|uniref:hypothetical protein n=1 Tax=Gordonia westfalica TaxID=158898 RepID=UPI00111443CF|nr:hypothetical protein [Gordonia westfalica]